MKPLPKVTSPSSKPESIFLSRGPETGSGRYRINPFIVRPDVHEKALDAAREVLKAIRKEKRFQ